MFKTIKNALKTPEIRKRLLYTLLIIVIFRFGCHITVPGVDAIALETIKNSAATSISGLIDIISGGAFSKLSVFAMTITPYITASIVIQLLGMVIPSLERAIKEGGEEGKAKVNRYTKMLTLFLAFVEALGLYLTYSNAYKNYGVFINPGFGTGAIFVISLIAGTAFLMWLGEQITSKGIGNGISLIIFIGIISSLPKAVTTMYNLIYVPGVGISTTGIITSIAIILGALVLVAGVVFVQEAERRVPVQYAKKVVGRKMYGGQNTHIPLKLAMAGVMPVIFASVILSIPTFIAGLLGEDSGFSVFVTKYINYTTPTGFVLYIILIFVFGFFYTNMQINPKELSKNLNKNGGYIPGIRPGVETEKYISRILNRITFLGSTFMAIIAGLPIVFSSFINTGLPTSVSIGGTGVLIVVGVAIETCRQIESSLINRNYKGAR